MDEIKSPFSDRHGFHGAEREITIREDAPEEIRAGVVMLGYAAGMGPGGLRATICEVLLKRPDPGNWSAGNVENEVSRLIDNAPWYSIYDIAERLYGEIQKDDYTGAKPLEFERRLNLLFREHGVGWQMEKGAIIARGSEAFTIASKEAVSTMREAGKQRGLRRNGTENLHKEFPRAEIRRFSGPWERLESWGLLTGGF